MGLKSIESEWEGFARMVFAKTGASHTQINEMKKSFFAGYWAALCAMKEIGEPHISEDAGCEFLTARQDEGAAFYKDMIGEYAERN